jgi:hypothetical protein
MAVDLYQPEDLQRLDKFQFKVLNTLFSTPPTTSHRALLLLTNLVPINERNYILASSSWARAFDLKDDLTFFSSHTIKILEGLTYKPKILQTKFWKAVIRIQQLNQCSYVSALFYKQGDAEESYLMKFTRLQQERRHNFDQVLCRAVSPRNKPAAILSARKPIISRMTQRRLLLYRLGALPGHPYKICKKCEFMLEKEVDCTRQHCNKCLGLQHWVPKIIEEQAPKKWVPHPDERITELDRLLDILDEISTYPTQPPKEAIQEEHIAWSQQCQVIDEQSYPLWNHAGQIIDDICTSILGLRGDSLFSHDLPVIAVNGNIAIDFNI